MDACVTHPLQYEILKATASKRWNETHASVLSSRLGDDPMKGILLAIQSGNFTIVRGGLRASSLRVWALLIGICGLCGGISVSAQSVYGPPVPPAITSPLP